MPRRLLDVDRLVLRLLLHHHLVGQARLREQLGAHHHVVALLQVVVVRLQSLDRDARELVELDVLTFGGDDQVLAADLLHLTLDGAAGALGRLALVGTGGAGAEAEDGEEAAREGQASKRAAHDVLAPFWRPLESGAAKIPRSAVRLAGRRSDHADPPGAGGAGPGGRVGDDPGPRRRPPPASGAPP